jgi:hypothetical protein
MENKIWLKEQNRTGYVSERGERTQLPKLYGRKKSRSSEAVGDDTLDIDVSAAERAPQFDKDETSGSRLGTA